MTKQESITIPIEEYQIFLTLKKNYSSLEAAYSSLEKTISVLQQEKQTLQERSQFLEQQLSELKRLIFGAKRERFVPQENAIQLSLFDIPANSEDNQEKEEQTETIIYQRKKHKEKKQPLRTPLPSHLKRKEEIILPDNIPSGAKKIGETITETLEYTPASLYVRRIVRPKYIIESNDEKTTIITGELPALPIPKGNAGASMLSYLATSKFVDHLPFYRLRQILKRQGLDIASSTINGWFGATARLLELLYETSKKELLEADYLMADETPLPVLTKDKPGATHKGYYWVYYDPIKRLVLFDYQKTRGREGPNEFLKNYSGYLQTDGYTAYTNLSNGKKIILLACMAHARRKFEHAKDNDKDRAEHMLKLFQQLYHIERIAQEKGYTYDQIKSVRQEESIAILEQMEQWLKEQIQLVPPKSKIGQAIAYTLNLWPRLKRYTDDGRFKIDNNLIENSIRPVALGRKNYLFAGSHEAAQRAAMFYSFFATCKINQVEPYAWLKNTLERIPTHPVNKLGELLPMNNG